MSYVTVAGIVVGGAVALWKKSVLRGVMVGVLVTLTLAAVLVGFLILGGDR